MMKVGESVRLVFCGQSDVKCLSVNDPGVSCDHNSTSENMINIKFTFIKNISDGKTFS
jgi:hypothetical protein